MCAIRQGALQWSIRTQCGVALMGVLAFIHKKQVGLKINSKKRKVQFGDSLANQTKCIWHSALNEATWS